MQKPLNVKLVLFAVIQIVQQCLKKGQEKIKALEDDLYHRKSSIFEQKEKIENLFKNRLELFIQQEQFETLANNMSVDLTETKWKHDSESNNPKNKAKQLEEQINNPTQLIETYNHKK